MSASVAEKGAPMFLPAGVFLVTLRVAVGYSLSTGLFLPGATSTALAEIAWALLSRPFSIGVGGSGSQVVVHIAGTGV